MSVVCSKSFELEVAALFPCWICQGGDPDVPPAPPLPDNNHRPAILGYIDATFPFIDRAATAGGPVWDGIFAQFDPPSGHPWCRWQLTVAWVTINNQDAHYSLRFNPATMRWEISIAILTTTGFHFWNHFAADGGECRPTGIAFTNTYAGNNILTPVTLTLTSAVLP